MPRTRSSRPSGSVLREPPSSSTRRWASCSTARGDEVDAVGEVVGLRALGHAGQLGNPPRSGRRVAVLEQALDRRVEQLGARLGPAFLLRAAAGPTAMARGIVAT